MPELYFTDDADSQLAVLEGDHARKALLAVIVERLAWLERDAGDIRVRKDRFLSGQWVIPVHTAHDTWVILWEPFDAETLVVYIGEYIGEDFR